ncbi:MAG: BrnA antitoxin family protein [Alphaproteobacteria bacterium]|nr:BrnA antitoxin family protein [Alphaproteobacteria bacterium]
MKKRHSSQTADGGSGDESDALPPDFWERAEPGYIFLPKLLGSKKAEKLMRGKAGRPVEKHPGVRTTIRLAPEVNAYFRKSGKGWQTRINAVLKQWIAEHG